MLKKKLSKIALLAAAAFMLAGLPACSDGGGNEEEYSPTVERKITLYKNGESQGEKDSVAAALAAIPASGTDVWEIKLTKGTYTESEQLTYNGSATVRITGETDAAYGSDVIIKGIGSDYTTESGRSMFEIRGSGNTILKNIRMEHINMMMEYLYIGSDGREHKSTQREVIGHQSKGTLAAYNCSFISRQDTIRTESKAWFYKCYIEGDVDFLWIETSSGTSKAALYEDCELYAVGDRTKKAYFTAPRLPVTNEVGKGLVIWKSKLTADNRLSEVYLGRNPWDEATDNEKGTNYFKDYYENVAVVDSDWSGKALDSKVWSGSGAHGTDDQQFVGFKTCQKFPAPSNNCGAVVLTAEQVAAEYSNRNYILNRVYNITEETFENDSASSIWNLSALETEFGANASQSLPTKAFDPTSAKVVWDLASAWKDDNDKTSIQGSTQSGILKGAVDGSDDYTVKMHINANVNGQNGKFEAQAASSRTQINAGTVLTVPVTNGAIVSVTKNSGTFGIEGTETITYTHSGAATGIVIYCTANGYLTEVAVSKLNLTALSDELKNATAQGEVRAIGLDIKEATVMNGKTTTIKAIPYASYGASAGTTTWTSSNTSVATVVTGIVTVKAGTGTAVITATNNGHSASCTITAKATASWAVQAAEDATWTPSATTPEVTDATAVWENMVIVAATGNTFKCHEAGKYFKVNASSSIVLYIPMTKDGTITINGDGNCKHTVKVGTSGTGLTKSNNVWTYEYKTSEGVMGSAIGSMDGIEPTGTYAKIEFSGDGNSYCQTITRTY
ncbi:MAG: hypothetical protein K2I74_03355 [Treponemataceae bacterium]|nr:hypothetical protein [Treponemataceae bacterium]